MTKKDFLQLEQNKSLKTSLITSAILCYISAGITAIAGLASANVAGISFSPLMLIDAILILAIGLIIHLKQSFPASVVLLIYGVINIAAMVIMYHKLGGWLILVAGICAVYSTYKLNNEYKAFNNQDSIINNFDVPKE